ncbi:MAG: hypothetical protein KDC44_17195, partial [Phaeodactylibacter sp.]|nr:hypothetical protein [Phaeodactylibacter sp.]
MRSTITFLILWSLSLQLNGQSLPPEAATERTALLNSFKLVSRSDFEQGQRLLQDASAIAARYEATALLVEDSIKLALLYGGHRQVAQGRALLDRLAQMPILQEQEHLKLLRFKALGDLSIRDRKYDDALRYYDTIFHFDTSLIEIETVLLNRSLLYIFDDEFSKALTDLRYIEPRYAAKQDYTNLSIVYSRLGEILDESRDYDAAFKYYKKIPELEGIPPALKMSAYYRLGGLYKRLGNDSVFYYYWQVLANPKLVSKSVYNKTLGSMCSTYLTLEEADSVRYYCDLFEADCAANKVENSS